VAKFALDRDPSITTIIIIMSAYMSMLLVEPLHQLLPLFLERRFFESPFVCRVIDNYVLYLESSAGLRV